MVRLKAGMKRPDWLKTSYFNSTMVRLKEAIEVIQGKIDNLFQFHYGSVKSPAEKNSNSPSTNFNSTMVRLKAEGVQKTLIKSTNFNSTMVRLKGGFKAA